MADPDKVLGSVKAQKGKQIPQSAVRVSYDSAYKKMKKIMDAVEDEADTEWINSDEGDQRVRDKTSKQYREMMEGTDDPVVRQAYHDAYMAEVGNSYDYDPGWPAYKEAKGVSSMGPVTPLDGGKVDTGGAALKKSSGGNLQAKLDELLKTVNLEPGQAPEKIVPNAHIGEILTGNAAAGVKQPVQQPAVKGTFDTYNEFNGVTEDLGRAGVIRYDNRFKANAGGVHDLASAGKFIGAGMWESAKDGFAEGLWGGGMNLATKLGNFGIDKLNAMPGFTKKFGGKLPTKGAAGIISGGLTLFQIATDAEGWWKAGFDEGIVNKFSDSGAAFRGFSMANTMASKARADGHPVVGFGLNLEGVALLFDGIGKILEGIKGILELISNICFAIAVVFLIIAIFAMILGGAGAALMPIVKILLDVGTWLGTIASVIGAVSRGMFSVATLMHGVALLLVSSDPEAVQLVAGNLQQDLKTLTKEYVKNKTTKAVDQVVDKGEKKITGKDKKDGKGKDDGKKQQASGNTKPADKKQSFFAKVGIRIGKELAEFTSINKIATAKKDVTAANKKLGAGWRQNVADFQNRKAIYQQAKSQPTGKQEGVDPTKVKSQKKGQSLKRVRTNALKSDVTKRVEPAQTQLEQQKQQIVNGIDPEVRKAIEAMPPEKQGPLLAKLEADLLAIEKQGIGRVKAAGDAYVSTMDPYLKGSTSPADFQARQKAAGQTLDSATSSAVQSTRGKMDVAYENFKVAVLGTTPKAPANVIYRKVFKDWLSKTLWGKASKKRVADVICAKLEKLGLNAEVQEDAAEAIGQNKTLPGDTNVTTDSGPAANQPKAPEVDPTLPLQQQIQQWEQKLDALAAQEQALEAKTETDLDKATEATYQAVLVTHKLDLEAKGKEMADEEFERLKQRQKRLNAINDRNELIVCFHVASGKQANIEEIRNAVDSTKQATEAQQAELTGRKKVLADGKTKNSGASAEMGQVGGPFQKFLAELITKFVGGGVTSSLGRSDGGANKEAPGGAQAQGSASTLDDLAANGPDMTSKMSAVPAQQDQSFAATVTAQNEAGVSIQEADKERVETVSMLQADADEAVQSQIMILKGIQQMETDAAEADAAEQEAQSAYDSKAVELSGVASGIDMEKDAAVAAINVVGEDHGVGDEYGQKRQTLENEKDSVEKQLMLQILEMQAQMGMGMGGPMGY